MPADQCLEDFVGYYVRCFHAYRRTCTRLHFFTRDFAAADFDALLSGGGAALSPGELQAHYLGFIVVKPLPQSMIGRTCLKTYPDDGGRRAYPIIRSYDANLFGIRLTVDTLAFQEQDTVAAACATSALWAAFHGTGSVFHHSIPSPVEITKAATRHSPPVTRPPSLGRSRTKAAFRLSRWRRPSAALAWSRWYIAAGDAFALKASVYAYLKAQIPPLLGAALIDPTLPAVRTPLGYTRSRLPALAWAPRPRSRIRTGSSSGLSD